jgi:hypothetical protein
MPQKHQQERFKKHLDTKNNGTLPIYLACFERLNVIIVTLLQLNLQLKKN